MQDAMSMQKNDRQLVFVHPILYVHVDCCRRQQQADAVCEAPLHG